MRILTYYVATSVDGYIAREDGSFDGFLPEGPHVADYLSSLSGYDAVLMGRKTYDIGLQFGKTDPYPAMDSYVFSRTMTESPDPKVTLVRDGAVDVVRNLKEQPGGPIYLCGGGEVAALLFAEGLIDELIVKVNPFLMGTGIPLFSGVIPQTDLELVKHTAYANGCVWLYYRVK